jgi:lysozyme
MTEWRDRLQAQLILHEGLERKPYKDTVGKLTIGVGRNLDDVGISEEEARVLLDNDMARTLDELDRHIPYWRDLDDARRLVLADMAFNLGIFGLLRFTRTLHHLTEKDFVKAAAEMERSLWFKQTGKRARTLVQMMRDGQ